MTKPTKWHVRPAKTRISLGIRPVWSESSLCDQCVAKGPSFLHVDSEDSDQTGRMPRLIWVFVGAHTILLVLSWGGSIGLVTYLRPTLPILPIEQGCNQTSSKPAGLWKSTELYYNFAILKSLYVFDISHSGEIMLFLLMTEVNLFFITIPGAKLLHLLL